MPRDRHIGPLPFGLDLANDGEISLRQALKLWWNWSAWEVTLNGFGELGFSVVFIAGRNVQSPPDERRMRVFDDGGEPQEPVEPFAARASATAYVGANSLDCAVGVFAGRAGLATEDGPLPLVLQPNDSQGTWSGRHLVAKASRLVAGAVRPTMAFELAGTWEIGGSDVLWQFAAGATGGDFSGTVTWELPGGGEITRPGMGAITGGFEASTITARLRPAHFLFNGASGDIYTAAGAQLKDPLKSRVP